MSNIITVENLGKKYTIGHQKQAEYHTLRDSLSHGVRSAYQRMRHPFSPNSEDTTSEEFWALKDISFEVKQGDRIGIIGRNGAGKSTLLKILSRITHPTTGKIHIKGRVASLLEVGTGFHPELTGRENIFLNGAILGMTKNDIKMRFDEIVAFAEIEKFLDTPVKRYSSGMYVRLAFAVAAHLEPEILIVDEVLAVGDLSFQEKCIGKMRDISSGARTIIFVSHNLGAVRDLCPNTIWIESGAIHKTGKTDKILNIYNESMQKGFSLNYNNHSKYIKNIECLDEYDKETSRYHLGEKIRIRISLKETPNQEIVIGVGVRDVNENQILHFCNRDDNCRILCKKRQVNSVNILFDNILNTGNYSISIWIGDHQMQTLEYSKNCIAYYSDLSNIGNSRLNGSIILNAEWIIND